MKERLLTLWRPVLRKIPGMRSALLSLYGLLDRYSWTRNLLTRGRPIAIPTSRGEVAMLPEGHIAEVLWRSDFEKEERNLVEAWVKPGMRVLNVGANAGLYSLIAAKLVGDEGKCTRANQCHSASIA